MNRAIDVEALIKAYGGRTVAVADLTLRVDAGSIFGFLGPNGAGKTTSVKMLLGLVRPTCGTGTVLGAPLGDRRTRGRIGYLPELFRYPDWSSGAEVLRYHAALAGIERAARDREIDRVLGLAGLSSRAGDRVGTYSKGMQQRLGLAVALLGDPDLVFLDEPTSALDPIGRRDVREVLRSLRAQGKTVFLNSHLLTEVEQVCDRVAFVRAGRAVGDGTLSEIVGEPSSVRVRAVANGTPLADVLGRFGRVALAPGGASISGVGNDAIPDVVAALVSSGARVYGIESVERTLEERFLEMVGDS